MSGFDFSNLGGLMQLAQQRMQQLKDNAEKLRCEGTAGGGLVKVVVSGDYQVQSVSIAPKAMGDRELLEDLVRAATADALGKVRLELAQQIKTLTGGLPIPPGLMPF